MVQTTHNSPQMTFSCNPLKFDFGALVGKPKVKAATAGTAVTAKKKKKKSKKHKKSRSRSAKGRAGEAGKEQVCQIIFFFC